MFATSVVLWMRDREPPSGRARRLAERASQQRRDAVMRSIEDVALDLFAERPMAEVTIEEIALQAGTSIRTLYRHFPTKEEILGKYPERGATALADLLRARPVTETHVEALRAAIGVSMDDLVRSEFDRWIAASAPQHEPCPGGPLLHVRGRVGTQQDDRRAGRGAGRRALAGDGRCAVRRGDRCRIPPVVRGGAATSRSTSWRRSTSPCRGSSRPPLRTDPEGSGQRSSSMGSPMSSSRSSASFHRWR